MGRGMRVRTAALLLVSCVLVSWSPRLAAAQTIAGAPSHGAAPDAAKPAASGRKAIPAVGAWVSIGPNPISFHGSIGTQYLGKAPYSGRVTSVAPVPGTAAAAYIGTADGGVWKTVDDGVTWSPVFDSQPDLAIGAVTASMDHAGVVYAGTGEANSNIDAYAGSGFYRSTDGGATWTSEGAFQGCSIAKILALPAAPADILLLAAVRTAVHTPVVGGATCSNQGLWRSGDGGTTWQAADPGGVTGDFSDVAGDASVVYAGAPGSGVFMSTDLGQTWAGPLAGGLPNASLGRIAVAVAPSDDRRAYVAIANSGSGDLLGIWTTADQGATWTAVVANPAFCNIGSPQCWYDLALTVDPADATSFYGAGVGLFKYQGSGASFLAVGQGKTGIHVDMHAVAFDAAGRLWAGSDGGIYRTADAGSTFANLNNGLSITQFYPGLSTTFGVLGGAQDNGTVRLFGNAAATGEEVWGGDGGYTLQDPSTTSTFYVSNELGSIFKTVDGGQTFTRIFRTAYYNVYAKDTPGWVAPLVMDPSNPHTLFVGTQRIWRTTSGGDLGFSLVSNQFDAAVSAIAVSPGTATRQSVVWAGTQGGSVYRSVSGGGAPWVKVAGAGLPGRFITHIAADATTPRIAYASVSGFCAAAAPAQQPPPTCPAGQGHVFKTADGGATWSDISGQLPNVPVSAVVEVTAARDALVPPSLYAATDTGVYASVDGSGTWQRLGSGLPNSVAVDVVYDSGRLFAATHGRGAYEMQMAPVGAVSHSTAAAGDLVGVAGSGFAPNEPVSVYVEGTLVRTSTADASGSVADTFTTPALPPNDYVVTLLGQWSGAATDLPFEIGTAGWPQTYYDAGSTNYNAQERTLTLTRLQHAVLKWWAPADGRLYTHVLIDAGMVFTTQGGTLVAYAEAGCLSPPCAASWVAAPPAGQSPRSPPLVAGGGLVYAGFADANGNVSIAAYAEAGCGSVQCPPVWETATGTQAPPAIGGQVMPVPSPDDTVLANGVLVTYGNIHGDPSLDSEVLMAYDALGCGGAFQCAPLWQGVSQQGFALNGVSGVVAASGHIYTVGGLQDAGGTVTGVVSFPTAGCAAVCNGTPAGGDSAAPTALAYVNAVSTAGQVFAAGLEGHPGSLPPGVMAFAGAGPPTWYSSSGDESKPDVLTGTLVVDWSGEAFAASGCTSPCAPLWVASGQRVTVGANQLLYGPGNGGTIDVYSTTCSNPCAATVVPLPQGHWPAAVANAALYVQGDASGLYVYGPPD